MVKTKFLPLTPEESALFARLGNGKPVIGFFPFGGVQHTVYDTWRVDTSHTAFGQLESARPSFSTREAAVELHERRCKQHNAYLMWYWKEDDHLVVVHRRHLDKWIIFSLEDEEIALTNKWCPAIARSSNRFYVYAHGKEYLAAHRVVASRMLQSETMWESVDHIDRNTLDNRRSNLRSGQHNQWNRGMSVNNTSGHTHVTRRPERNLWRFVCKGMPEKLFTDAKYGSKDAAYEAAVAHAKEQTERAGILNGVGDSVAMARKRKVEQAQLDEELHV